MTAQTPPTKNLCSVTECQTLITHGHVRIIDCSWYLPTQQRNAHEEFLAQHIPGAQFFDIDAVCDTASDLPHMLPSETDFASAVSALGISNDTQLIVYDAAGLFSAARLWWMFKVFGHNTVKILNGGLSAWLDAGHAVESETERSTNSFTLGSFTANLQSDLVASKEQLIENCDSKEFIVLDARSTERFLGQAPEPRPGLPSGHMPQSVTLPFNRLVENGQLKPVEELKEIFAQVRVNESSTVITSCGSGVTASIITLALDECGYGLHKLYDGAWAEWGTSCGDLIIDKGVF